MKKNGLNRSELENVTGGVPYQVPGLVSFEELGLNGDCYSGRRNVGGSCYGGARNSTGTSKDEFDAN